MFIHQCLRLLRQRHLFGRQELSLVKVRQYDLAQLLFFGVGSMASVLAYPFLDLVIVFCDDGLALCKLPVLVFDLLLKMLNLVGEIGSSIRPFIKNLSGVHLLGLSHVAARSLDEVDGEIVSREKLIMLVPLLRALSFFG